MLGLKTVTYTKISPKMGTPELELGLQKKKNGAPRDIFGNATEEEEKEEC